MIKQLTLLVTLFAVAQPLYPAAHLSESTSSRTKAPRKTCGSILKKAFIFGLLATSGANAVTQKKQTDMNFLCSVGAVKDAQTSLQAIEDLYLPQKDAYNLPYITKAEISLGNYRANIDVLEQVNRTATLCEKPVLKAKANRAQNLLTSLYNYLLNK